MLGGAFKARQRRIHAPSISIRKKLNMFGGKHERLSGNTGHCHWRALHDDVALHVHRMRKGPLIGIAVIPIFFAGR